LGLIDFNAHEPQEDTTMASWLHTTILATSLAATVAVGIASAAILTNAQTGPVVKSDRLPIVADAQGYFTVETRTDGLSVLNRVPID
jgi:hypothetical protein